MSNNHNMVPMKVMEESEIGTKCAITKDIVLYKVIMMPRRNWCQYLVLVSCGMDVMMTTISAVIEEINWSMIVYS